MLSRIRAIRALAAAAILASNLSIAHAGTVGGSTRTVEQVKANITDVYNLSFIAGQEAIVDVKGDGDTDLDLYIYDSSGNLITKDEDYTDHCVARWTPKWTGKFTIKIKNRGGVPNSYVMTTN
jgi:hypothetical protein